MKLFIQILVAALLLGGVGNVFALMAELKEPGVAHTTDYPKAAQEQVAAALKRPDYKFLKGHFINWHTSLLYAGDTKALNLFLDALAKCPGVTLHVSFVSDPIPGEPCDWNVAHDALANSFNVRVNLSSGRIQLPDLYLPEVKGPAVRTVAALTKGELIGHWGGPCLAFKLKANGTGEWRVRGPEGPLPKPESFRWDFNGWTLRLQEAKGQQHLEVSRAEGDSLELKFPNGSSVRVWKNNIKGGNSPAAAPGKRHVQAPTSKATQ